MNFLVLIGLLSSKVKQVPGTCFTWEKTYEECVEAAINYYYDEIVRRIEL